MTALSQDTKRDSLAGLDHPVPPKLSFGMAANTRVYGGGLLALNSAGYAVRPQSSGTRIPGVVMAGVDNTTANNPVISSAGAKIVECQVGAFPFATDGTFVTGVPYQNAYAVDDNTLSASSNGGAYPYAGFLLQAPLLGGSESPLVFLIGFANPYPSQLNEPSVATLTGPSASTTVAYTIPTNTATTMRIKAVSRVTTRGGGSEAVGDTNHVDTIVTVKNVAGTVSVVANSAEVSIKDADTTMAIPVGHCGVAASGATAVVTFTSPSGLNALTVTTVTADVEMRSY